MHKVKFSDVEVKLEIDKYNLCSGPDIFEINGIKASIYDFLTFNRQKLGRTCHFSRPSLDLKVSEDKLAETFKTTPEIIARIAIWLKGEYGKYPTCDGCE